VWFDYLDALNRLVMKDPKSGKPLERRRKLLEPEGFIQDDDGTIRLKPTEVGGEAKR
jgi:hypothetical protein